MKFPDVIDNSLLSEYKACAYSASLKYFLHFKPSALSVHLIAGKAYAAGLEEYRRGRYIRKESLQVALNSALLVTIKEYGPYDSPDWKKSWLSVCEAIVYYADRYPVEIENFQPFFIEGLPTIEISMAMPLPINHPDTGEPIIYVGRADQFVQDQTTGLIYLEDDKTTSELGASFQRKFITDSQFLGYTYMARRIYDLDIKGALIRAACFYVNRIDGDQTLCMYPPALLDDWYSTLIRTTKRMIIDYKKMKFNKALNAHCSAYGGCPFQDNCQSGTLPSAPQFVKKRWNPVLRIEEHLE